MEPTLLDDLDGQVALVSGANRGIGAAIADGLAELGAMVYAGTRDRDAIEAHRPVTLDVTNDAQVAAAIDRIEDEAGRLDVLVNNAGVLDDEGSLDTTPMATVDDVLAVNLRGAIALTRAALPLLTQRKGSRVVTLSSRMAQLATGMGTGSPAYRISKAGLNGCTVYLDAEYGPGLIANAVCPGWVRTDMGGTGAPRSVEQGADTPIWCARFAPGSPGGGFYRDRERIAW